MVSRCYILKSWFECWSCVTSLVSNHRLVFFITHRCVLFLINMQACCSSFFIWFLNNRQLFPERCPSENGRPMLITALTPIEYLTSQFFLSLSDVLRIYFWVFTWLCLVIEIEVVLVSFLLQCIFKELFFHHGLFFVRLLVRLIETHFNFFLLARIIRTRTNLIGICGVRIGRYKLVCFYYFIERWSDAWLIPLSYFTRIGFKLWLSNGIFSIQRSNHWAIRFVLTHLPHRDLIYIIYS